MKRFLAGLIVGAVLATTAGAFAAGTQFRLLLNGRAVTTVPLATGDDGSPWVSPVPFARALGAEARWDAVSGEVSVLGPPGAIEKPSAYLWVALLDPTLDLATFAASAQGYKGVIVEIGGDWIVTPPPSLKEYADGKITSDQLMARSRLLQNAVATSGPAPVPLVGHTEVSVIPKGASLVSSDGTYLGLLTGDKYGASSVCNEYGKHGSKYESESIWNEYGTYGGKFSSKSPFNEFATDPPKIVSNGKVIGYLTVSTTKTGGVSPLGICQLLKADGK